jgi:hypothetical protein
LTRQFNPSFTALVQAPGRMSALFWDDKFDCKKMWRFLLKKYMKMALIVCLNSAIWKLIREIDVMVRNRKLRE